MATDSLRQNGPSANRGQGAWSRPAGRAPARRSGNSADDTVRVGSVCAGCGETDRTKLNHRVRAPAWLAGPDRAARALVLCDACYAADERARRAPLAPRSIALWIVVGLLLLAFFELV